MVSFSKQARGKFTLILGTALALGGLNACSDDDGAQEAVEGASADDGASAGSVEGAAEGAAETPPMAEQTPPPPAAEPTPPPPPATNYVAGGTGPTQRWVKAHELNVRSEPSLHGAIVRKVHWSQLLSVTIQGKWAKLNEGEYVSTKYLTSKAITTSEPRHHRKRHKAAAPAESAAPSSAPATSAPAPAEGGEHK